MSEAGQPEGAGTATTDAQTRSPGGAAQRSATPGHVLRRISRRRSETAERIRAFAAVERRSRPTWRTWCVTFVALAAMVTTATIRTGVTMAPGPGLIALMLAAWVALAFRTLRPTLVLACVVVIEVCILSFLAVPDVVSQHTEGMGAYQPVPLASMLAVYTVAARTPRPVGWIAGCAAGGTLMVAGFLSHGRVTALTDLVIFYLVVTAAAIGIWVAGRRDGRERLAREREREMNEAVVGERLRIARELHDVLAHNLTLVNAQAGVAEYLLATQPQAAAAALRDITRHTSRAIDELRATIGLLRQADTDPDTDLEDGGFDAGMHPVPGIGALDGLAESHRSTGARIRLVQSGVPGALDQHADLAAFRIVQEALTNAAKHAPGMAIEISLAWSDPGVRIRVVSLPLPTGVRGHAPPGTGHGLIGMRERALAAGGQLRVGRLPDGRFEVVATLPFRQDPRRPDLSPAASSKTDTLPEGRETTDTDEGTRS